MPGRYHSQFGSQERFALRPRLRDGTSPPRDLGVKGWLWCVTAVPARGTASMQSRQRSGRPALRRHRRKQRRCVVRERRRSVGRTDLCSMKWGPQPARSLVFWPETSIEGPAVGKALCRSKHNELSLIGANAKLRQNTSQNVTKEAARPEPRKRSERKCSEECCGNCSDCGGNCSVCILMELGVAWSQELVNTLK